MPLTDSRRSYAAMALVGLLVVLVGGIVGGAASGHTWIAIATIGPYIGIAGVLLHSRFWSLA